MLRPIASLGDVTRPWSEPAGAALWSVRPCVATVETWLLSRALASVAVTDAPLMLIGEGVRARASVASWLPGSSCTVKPVIADLRCAV
jgi:hypothetical protein